MLFAPLGVCLLQMLRLEGGEGNGKGQTLRLGARVGCQVHPQKADLIQWKTWLSYAS